jgi:HD-GYP domain-containing protein (c-di-GMP phosphodiesterase class II)
MPASNKKNQALLILDEAYRDIHGAKTMKQLIRTLEERSARLVSAQLATLFLLEDQGDGLRSLVAYRDEGRTRISCPIGQGIAGSVAQENGFYVCNMTNNDPLYIDEIDGLPGLDANNVLCVTLSDGDESMGVIEAVNKNNSVSFTEDDAFWLQKLAEHGSLAMQRLKRSEEGWLMAKNLTAALADAVDDKHVSTVGHTDRVRQMALAVGRDMNLTDGELEELEFSVLLHDIGRLALAPEVYEGLRDMEGGAKRRQGYASPDDRLHLVLTEALLRGLPLPASMKNLKDIALSHHEKANGGGFPKGVRASELPLAARILAVANAFDMMTSGRDKEFTGKGLSDEEAVEVVKKRAGTDYDPAVVDRLVRNKLYIVEKRRFPRYEFEAPLDVEILDLGTSDPLGAESKPGSTQNPTRLETKVVDLSEGGVMFLSPTKLPQHALLRLRIHLPGDVLEALARTARHLPPREGETGWRVGAYFLWYGKVR